ncbi:MAG: AraC family ligand binding domain-containing protein [Eisenbergiella sp.]
MKEKISSFWNYEKKDRPFNLLMAGVSYCDGTYRIERKPENLYSFEYIYSGKGTLVIDGQRLEPKVGDVYFLKRGIPHCYWSDEKEPWTKIWICFNGLMAEAMFTAYLDKNVYLMRDCDISAQMETLLCRIEQFESDYEQLADETAKAVLEILQKLHRQGRSQTRTLPDQIKEWIDLHVEENVKLEQLCESLHYSRNHLINQFRGRYGITPYQYLREQKMRRQSGTFIFRNVGAGNFGTPLLYG